MISQLLFAFMALVRENHYNRTKYPWGRTARLHLLESVPLKKRAVCHRVEIVESKNCARRWKFNPGIILCLWSWAHWLSHFEGKGVVILLVFLFTSSLSSAEQWKTACSHFCNWFTLCCEIRVDSGIESLWPWWHGMSCLCGKKQLQKIYQVSDATVVIEINEKGLSVRSHICSHDN